MLFVVALDSDQETLENLKNILGSLDTHSLNLRYILTKRDTANSEEGMANALRARTILNLPNGSFKPMTNYVSPDTLDPKTPT